MTPVERLQGAIAKLQQYEGETWSSWPSEDAGYCGIAAANPGGGRQVIGEWVESEHDADLIVTLHRTIEAQLLILRHALARAQAKISGGGISRAVWSHERDALTLADATLNTPALAEGTI